MEKIKYYIVNISQLVSVAVIGQLFSILISPVLARLYSPEQFGIYADVISYGTIAATVFNGRYDLALIESKSSSTSNALIKISLFIGLICSAFLIIIVGLLTFFTNEDSSRYLFVVLIALIISQISVINHQWNSLKKYKRLSVNRLIQSTAPNILLLIMAFIWNSPIGMLFSYSMGLIIILLVNLKVYYYTLKSNFSDLIIIAKKFYRYPKYLIASTLSSELSGNLPIILASSFFAPEIAGFLFMANKLVSIPIAFIGNAIGDVYRQKAVETYNIRGECLKLHSSFLLLLIILGLIFGLSIYFFSEIAISLFFGEVWIETAKILKIYSLMMFFQFTSSPLSYSIVLNNSQRIDLVLQIFRLLFVIISFVVGAYFESFDLTLYLYVIGYSLYYISHSILQYVAVRGTK